MTTKRYSRLASVEEKKNIKNAYYYVALSILAIVLLIFLGIPMLVKFAGFVGDLSKSDKEVEIQDITPPAPPQFEDIPEYTNSKTVEIVGKSENGATISITSNEKISEVLANNEGKFNFSFNLKRGENTIYAKAIDTSGNESNMTQTYTVIFDDEEPEIEILSPEDNVIFYGSSQRQLTIKGVVTEMLNLTINGRFAVVKDDLTFSYSTTLSEGENKFEIIAKDAAGNEVTTLLTFNFSL